MFSNTSHVPWLRRLRASLLPRSPGFHSGQYKPKLSYTSGIKTGVSPRTSVPPVSISLTMLQTHFSLHIPLTRKTNGPSLGAFREQWSFGSRRDLHLAFRGLKQISTGINGKWTWDTEHVAWREMVPQAKTNELRIQADLHLTKRNIEDRTSLRTGFQLFIAYFKTIVSRLLSTYRDKTAWLRIRLAALSCYCADHSELSQFFH